jgi:MYXO-CTERM domain-containing protein
LRFRIGTDEEVGANGWYIDDVAFTGLTNKPFSAQINDDGICVNNPPIADAGADQTVLAGTNVTLDGSGSSDPDNAPSPLTYAWSQTAGPNATLMGSTSAMPNFIAPSVTSDTTLTFELKVNDGADTVTDTVDITVQPNPNGEGGAGGGPGDGGTVITCNCSLPGDDQRSPLPNVGGGSLLALFGAWLVRRRRQNRPS